MWDNNQHQQSDLCVFLRTNEKTNAKNGTNERAASANVLFDSFLCEKQKKSKRAVDDCMPRDRSVTIQSRTSPDVGKGLL